MKKELGDGASARLEQGLTDVTDKKAGIVPMQVPTAVALIWRN